jgi:DNA-binding Xre family transcriptional regulator
MPSRVYKRAGDPLYEALGRCIRRRRLGREMTQAWLAHAVRIHIRRVSLYENGHVVMPTHVLRRIAAVLHCQLSDLLREAEVELAAMAAAGRDVSVKLAADPMRRGPRRARADGRLTEPDVVGIIAEIAAGRTGTAIARERDISPTQVSRIKHSRCWPRVPRPWLQRKEAAQ